MINETDYIEASFRIFGLYGADNEGKCLCGNPHCKAIFKHPRSSNWQHTPHWSDEQLDIMAEMGQFDTGFGVLCDEHIIIDIDPRNGGKLEGFQEYYDLSGFVVATGGGGWHIYFSKPKCAALASHLPQYQGIDFKSSGYVVGCGSVHASGSTYEAEKGHPCDITEAPDKLLHLLEKKDTHRAEYNGKPLDVTDSEVAEMLGFIDPDSEYNDWIKFGMAVHHATHGNGFGIWDAWSSKGKKYEGSQSTDNHWHSFGKSGEAQVTIGTLIHHAEEAGYKQSVTFDSEVFTPVEIIEQHETDLVKEMLDYPFDPLRPPALVGEIVSWINANTRSPRENLAVGAALHVVGNLASCSYKDTAYGGVPNLYIACIAESSSGKEGIQRATKNLLKSCGLSRCVHTLVKSEQEIVKNLIADSRSFYRIDEFGEHLAKFDSENAPPYLRGIKPRLLSSYSESGGEHELGGDLLRDTEKILATDVTKLQKIIDNNEDKGGRVKEELDKKIKLLENIESGIQDSFVSLIGFATPNKFYQGINYDSVTNGMVGRLMFFIERNGNPRSKRKIKINDEPDDGLKFKMLGVAAGGGDLVTEKKAVDAMEAMIDYFEDKAEEDSIDSMTPIWRRGIELTIKISLILSVSERMRTFEHVCWAFNLVKQELESRVNIAISTIAETDKERTGEGLMRKILSKITEEHGESTGVLKAKCGVKYTKADVESAISILEKNGRIVAKKSDNKKGAKTKRWFLV